MVDFIKNNVACDILVLLGILAIIITWGARYESKKTGRFVSGVPALGGILIIVGFLTSNVKWLAVIGLFDPDLIYFLVKIVPDIVSVEREERNWIPPGEMEGKKVVLYTKYNKCYEEMIEEREAPYANEIHTANRYVVLQEDNGFTLLKIEHTTKIFSRSFYKTMDECKMAASDKAKWVEV